WKPGLEPADKVIALNKLLKATAKNEGVIYVDYYSSMVNEQKGMKEAYSEDGVHPNLAGYKVMEPLVENAIAKALHKKINRMN
ncbi:MAG: GDSL-type esterase/lipase family protein, partial [Paludibacter sp.]|nr:GDSL-type esterase/lipase family protein [Paludibacter sp.]